MKIKAAARRPRAKSAKVPATVPAILDLRPRRGSAAVRDGRTDRKRQQALAHFERAFALEASDLDAARQAYCAALDTYAGQLEATINLGRLMHLNGELAEAESVYRAAEHGSALLSFNIAMLLEDLKRDEEAVDAYLAALAQEPTLHEAHFHLGVLHERQERPREALKHLLAFRRLNPG